MTVADLIERLKQLPQDTRVISYEDGNWGEPEPHLVDAGKGFMGLKFDEPTVIL